VITIVWVANSFVLTIFAEQDEGLERLEETVLSTKHIALAVNEELTLHTRLIVSACAPKRTTCMYFH
jgi:hypothetical protein